MEQNQHLSENIKQVFRQKYGIDPNLLEIDRTGQYSALEIAIRTLKIFHNLELYDDLLTSDIVNAVHQVNIEINEMPAKLEKDSILANRYVDLLNFKKSFKKLQDKADLVLNSKLFREGPQLADHYLKIWNTENGHTLAYSYSPYIVEDSSYFEYHGIYFENLGSYLKQWYHFIAEYFPYNNLLGPSSIFQTEMKLIDSQPFVITDPKDSIYMSPKTRSIIQFCKN